MTQQSGERNDRAARIRERRGETQQRKAPEPVRMQTFMRSAPDQLQKQVERGRRKKFNARWLSGIFALIFGGLAAAYGFLPIFRFDNIEINGVDIISRDELIYFTGAKGQPIFTVRAQDIRAILLQHYQEISDAEVTIAFPAKMRIDLEERIPVVEWDFGGSRFWLDADGIVLNESTSHGSTIHIYADSFPGASSRDDRELPTYFSKDTLETMLTMGKYAPQDRPLYFTYDNGYGWDTDEGWRVFFGKSDSDIEEKLRMLDSLTKYFIKNEIQPVMLSLEFKDAPYYRFVE